MTNMIKSTTPKIIFTCRFRFALNNPDNKYKKDFYKKILKEDVGGLVDYYSNPKKEIINVNQYYENDNEDDILKMMSYYSNKNKDISKTENKRINIVLENGMHATPEEGIRITKQLIDASENSNIYKGILSFDTEWITQTIKIQDLEKLIAKEVMPKFLKHCGFVDMKKMRYFFSFHGNAPHLHCHLSFAELKPNHINRDGKTLYRRMGMITEEEKNYLKNELLLSIERKSISKPLITELNKDIEELKKYFNPKDKNFILKDINNIRLEEKIVKLGFLVENYRTDKTKTKVKYGSIKNNELGKEIKKITKEIKEELFYNKESLLFKQRVKVNNDLKNLNDYYIELNNQNHIESKVKNNKLVVYKTEYVNSYILNSIINHALFRTNVLQNIVKTKNTIDKITLDDLLQEVAYEKSRKYKNKNVKLIILKDSLTNKKKSQQYKLNHEIINAVKNLNYEMEESAKEFHRLFINNDYKK